MALPMKHIVIGEQQLKKLKQDVWSDQFVNASLRMQGKNHPIRLRYRGGHTREYPKKSYELRCNGRTLHYNAEYDDPSMIRNALSFRFFQWIGVPSPNTRHCELKWNGEWQGVYLEIEAVNRRFFQKRRIPAQSLIYAVNDRANFELTDSDTRKRKASLFSGYRLKLGTRAEQTRLTMFVTRMHQLKQQRLLHYLNHQLDIDNYLRWLAGAVFTGNYDGFDQNYALYRHRTKHKYRIIPWDYEGTWGRNCYGEPCKSTLVRITGYNALTRKLLAYKSVRARYKSILKEILNNTFTVNKIMPVADRMMSQIADSIHRDTHRKWPPSEFDNESALIRNYIKERREIISEGMSKL